MTNNMENFDFGALDSAAFEETMSFLNNYDPTLLPNPSSGALEALSEPLMDHWPDVEDPAAWNILGNADLPSGVPDALTDSRGPGFGLSSRDMAFGEYPLGLHQVMESETAFGLGESGQDVMQCKTWAAQVLYPQGNELKNSDPLPDGMALLCRTCDWPSCTSSVIYSSELELSYHKTDVHVAEILKGWPGSCSWPGCTSKIFFKTSKRLESHVHNIHITPLCCIEAECDYKKPFERQADLERHIASRHLRERKYKCRYHQCKYRPGFTRKDKLKHHEKTCHKDKFPCQFNHCVFGYPSEHAQQSHYNNTWWDHHLYECGIGSCYLTSKSSFARHTLAYHLEDAHKISADVAARVPFIYHKYYLFTSENLPAGFSEFQDCESCVQKLKEAASSKDVEQHQ